MNGPEFTNSILRENQNETLQHEFAYKHTRTHIQSSTATFGIQRLVYHFKCSIQMSFSYMQFIKRKITKKEWFTFSEILKIKYHFNSSDQA